MNRYRYILQTYFSNEFFFDMYSCAAIQRYSCKAVRLNFCWLKLLRQVEVSVRGGWGCSPSPSSHRFAAWLEGFGPGTRPTEPYWPSLAGRRCLVNFVVFVCLCGACCCLCCCCRCCCCCCCWFPSPLISSSYVLGSLCVF